jgi:molybdopterin-containing oxidoreductase family iron-sulfur binding subunit
MVIDLKKCIGCYSCVITCKQEHFIPPNVFWNRLVIKETGEYPQVNKHVYPVLCNHCAEAPCVKVCPSGASNKREDGVVLVNSGECVGCGYCVVACPYQQRTTYKDENELYFPGQGRTELETIGRELYHHEQGTPLKCNFCAEIIDRGISKGLVPGIDREATPACVNNCPPSARHFGDLDDPESEVSILIRRRSGLQLHSGYGTNPSVYYIV